MNFNMGKKYDYLIVGSGLFGLTFARLCTDVGKKCLIIEKRHEIGGNIRCDYIEGINVHKYGPHIFHTDNEDVWNFVNRYVKFNNFRYSPIANYEGEYYNLPFNMYTFNQILGIKKPETAIKYFEDIQKYQHENTNLEEQAISMVGKNIYEILIKGYTEKQWGKKCSELPPDIIKRLPLRFTYDNNYFNDKYQGIPIGGYNELINALSDGIDCITDVDFFNSEYYEWEKHADKLVYTGPIDLFYKYSEGKLEWRSLNFRTKILDKPNYQGCAVINFTSKTISQTRIIEHKHFETFNEDIYHNPKTVITFEEPISCTDNVEPYYPINDKKNTYIYLKYKDLCDKENNVIFGGRLAEYKYYDMDDTIISAMKKFQKCVI